METVSKKANERECGYKVNLKPLHGLLQPYIPTCLVVSLLYTPRARQPGYLIRISVSPHISYVVVAKYLTSLDLSCKIAVLTIPTLYTCVRIK